MTTLTITKNTDWQEIATIAKSKGEKVVIMSEKELSDHTKKAIALEWLMNDLEQSEEDLRQGRYTDYTIEELKNGKMLADIKARHNAKQGN
ncbi:MAG: hypothetical protein FWB72_00465 [Firmicutes bacterium]|nr:hypothetical protein [Bacillota bacterium]